MLHSKDSPYPQKSGGYQSSSTILHTWFVGVASSLSYKSFFWVWICRSLFIRILHLASVSKTLCPAQQNIAGSHCLKGQNNSTFKHFGETIETKTFINGLLSCSIKVNASKVVTFVQKQKPPEISRFQTNQLHALSMWEKLHSMSYPPENKKGLKHDVKVVQAYQFHCFTWKEF